MSAVILLSSDLSSMSSGMFLIYYHCSNHSNLSFSSILAELVGGLLYVVDGLLVNLGPLLVTLVATVKGLLFFTLGGLLRIL